MQKYKFFHVLVLLSLPLGAMAGHQVCGKREVPSNVRTCPDGSIPMYVADEIKPYVPPQPAARPSRPVQANDNIPSGRLVRRDDAARPTPVQDHSSTGRPQADATANLNYYFGVWRTNIPGAVWTSPSGYQGREWLHVSAGAAAGDLIIKPDGTYVWNSYGGKSGRWISAADAVYPIVLIDTSENRRWKVGADPKHTGGRDIMIWDGNSFYYNGRK
ncbi:MAG TPA: hypothetical protein VNN06_13540 [Ramlibacter sp.]|nr:hypothetical protein [Ramlibacter sp.]